MFFGWSWGPLPPPPDRKAWFPSFPLRKKPHRCGSPVFFSFPFFFSWDGKGGGRVRDDLSFFFFPFFPFWPFVFHDHLGRRDIEQRTPFAQRPPYKPAVLPGVEASDLQWTFLFFLPPPFLH